MHLNDDGDMIRGLGFVALNAAYIEEKIDECLELFISIGMSDKSMRRTQVSSKLKELKRLLAAFTPFPQELDYLPDHLESVRELLERRNEMIHGRIYVDPALGDVRRSGRVGVPDTAATSLELYNLANELASAIDPLAHASVFRLRRLLKIAGR
jgi:hypothetical protein